MVESVPSWALASETVSSLGPAMVCSMELERWSPKPLQMWADATQERPTLPPCIDTVTGSWLAGMIVT